MFIDQHRERFGVEPICRVLRVAPSAYRRHAARQRNPELRSDRQKLDERLKHEIEQVWKANREVYGADKVWRQMNREGISVARCTVERLMQALGLQDTIDDILITLGKQYHIIRPLATKDGIFIYLVLDKARANLALARRKVQDIEKLIEF